MSQLKLLQNNVWGENNLDQKFFSTKVTFLKCPLVTKSNHLKSRLLLRQIMWTLINDVNISQISFLNWKFVQLGDLIPSPTSLRPVPSALVVVARHGPLYSLRIDVWWKVPRLYTTVVKETEMKKNVKRWIFWLDFGTSYCLLDKEGFHCRASTHCHYTKGRAQRRIQNNFSILRKD